jgi:hypothetical protein
LERVASVCFVAGAASVFTPWAGSVVETGLFSADPGDLPQPIRSTVISIGRTTHEDMPEINQRIGKKTSRKVAREPGR